MVIKSIKPSQAEGCIRQFKSTNISRTGCVSTTELLDHLMQMSPSEDFTKLQILHFTTKYYCFTWFPKQTTIISADSIKQFDVLCYL